MIVSHIRSRPDDTITLFCGYCERPMRVCEADQGECERPRGKKVLIISVAPDEAVSTGKRPLSIAPNRARAPGIGSKRRRSIEL